MTPELSFNVSITTPLAFAVEANGTVDIVDAGNGLTLSRFNNAGTLLSQAARIQPYGASYYTGAIDKANSAFYVSYKNSVIQETGDFSFKILYYVGAITKYNFSGQQQSSFDLPGRTTISTTCYTPSLMTVDAQSTLWIADQVCDQVLTYNTAGTLGQDFPLVYTAYPRGIWPAPSGNVFVTESVCDSNACPHLVTYEYSSGGAQQTSFAANSQLGQSWDSRTLYMASTTGSTLQRFILDQRRRRPSRPGSGHRDPARRASNGELAGGQRFRRRRDPLLDLYRPKPEPIGFRWKHDADLLRQLGAELRRELFLGGHGAGFLHEPADADLDQRHRQLHAELPEQPARKFRRRRRDGNGRHPEHVGDVYLDACRRSRRRPGDLHRDLAGGRTGVRDRDDDRGELHHGQRTGLRHVRHLVGEGLRPVRGVHADERGTQTYEPIFENLPPPAPAITGGTGVTSEHTLTPSASLSWSTSIDPDGDPVSYRLYLGTNPGALTLAQDSSQTSYALGGMTFGTTYYWQVSAYDPYGGVGTTPTQSLLVQLQNNPSAAVHDHHGNRDRGDTRHRRSFSLGPRPWTRTAMPSPTRLTLRPIPRRLRPCRPRRPRATSDFQIGTTYYWQVIARDGFGGATSSGLQSLFRSSATRRRQCRPINPRRGRSPTTALLPRTRSSGESSTDPTAIRSSTASPTARTPATWLSVSSAPLGYTLTNLPLNQAIYYQIVATDIYGASSPSPVNWVYYQFADNPPGPFDVVGTTGTVFTRQTSANLYLDAVHRSRRRFRQLRRVGGHRAVGTRAPGRHDEDLRTFFRTWRSGRPITGAWTPMTASAARRPSPRALQACCTYSTTRRRPCRWSFKARQSFPSTPWSRKSRCPGRPFRTPTATPSTMSSMSGLRPPASRGSIEHADELRSSPTRFWARLTTGRSARRTPTAARARRRFKPRRPFSRTTRRERSPWPGNRDACSRERRSQVLAWGASVDPDGDAVSYALSVSTNPARLAVVQASTATSLPLGFTFGTTYYWSVSAFDGFGGTTTITGGTQSLLPTFFDQAPMVVQIPLKPVVSTMRDSVDDLLAASDESSKAIR